MLTSSTTVPDAPATSDDGFRPPKSAMVSADPSDFASSFSSSIAGVTQAFHFSSGNPRIEEIRGVVHLFRDEVSSSSCTSSFDLPQPEKSVCFVCHTSENLWICVICGFVGCAE